MKIHWNAIASCDFFDTEVLTMRGYVRFAVQIELRDPDGRARSPKQGIS